MGKINQRLGLLRRAKSFLPLDAKQIFYTSTILPLFDYADIIWGDKNNSELMNSLQTLENKAAKLIPDLFRRQPKLSLHYTGQLSHLADINTVVSL
jgi:hypothetical protein